LVVEPSVVVNRLFKPVWMTFASPPCAWRDSTFKRKAKESAPYGRHGMSFKPTGQANFQFVNEWHRDKVDRVNMAGGRPSHVSDALQAVARMDLRR
jgi:hypothetical protein